MAAEGVAAEGAAAAKKTSKLPLIGGALVMLAAGGGAAYWFTGRQAPVALEAREVPLSARGLVSLEPFVANLADPGGQRFVRATVQLVVSNALQAAEVNEKPVLLMQARATILELLTTQTADTLVTPDGKAALRKAIGERVTASLHDVEVVDVLFSDFVVQF